MILLVFTLLSLLVVLLRGGRFEQLGEVNIRFAPLLVLAFISHILIFTPILGPYLNQTQTGIIYSVSMFVVWFTLFLNWRLPGMPIMTLGVFLNWLAITLNGGFMPSSVSALRSAGLHTQAALEPGVHHNNTVLVTESTRLPFLTDIFAVPASLPLSNVFSVGDVLLAIGVAWFIQSVMTAPRPEKATEVGQVAG